MATYYVHRRFPTQRVAHAEGEAVAISPQQAIWYLPDGRIGLEPPFVPSPWIREVLYRDELEPVWIPTGAAPLQWDPVPLYRDELEPSINWQRQERYRDELEPTIQWLRVTLYLDEMES